MTAQAQVALVDTLLCPICRKVSYSERDYNAHWLDDHQRTIGGSKAPVLMGVHQYGTPVSLWQTMTAHQPIFSDVNDAMWFGTLAEPLIADWLEDRTGYRVERARHQLRHHEYDFIRGDVDRYVIDPNRRHHGIAEIKTTTTFAQRFWPDDRLALPYLWQSTHYHNIDVKADWGLFAILILPPEVRDTLMLIMRERFGDELDSSKAGSYFSEIATPIIERYTPSVVYTTRGEQSDPDEIVIDDELCGLLLEREVGFYRNHIETRIPPDPIAGTDDYKLLYPEEVAGKCLTASAPLIGQLKELQATRAMLKELKDTEDNLKSVLGIVIQDNERVIDADHSTIATYRKNKSGSRILKIQ